MKWQIVLPKQPIPWGWGLWSLADGPSHYLAENERGVQAYVGRAMLGERQMIELSLCPFCGSEQVTTSPCETITDDRPDVTWAAICKACGARVDRDTEEEAIAAWNTRA